MSAVDPDVTAAAELNAIFGRLEVPCEVRLSQHASPSNDSNNNNKEKKTNTKSNSSSSSSSQTDAGKYVVSTAALKTGEAFLEEAPLVCWPTPQLLALGVCFCAHCLRLASYRPLAVALSEDGEEERETSRLPEGWIAACDKCGQCFCSAACRQAAARAHALLCPTVLPALRALHAPACGSVTTAEHKHKSGEASNPNNDDNNNDAGRGPASSDVKRGQKCGEEGKEEDEEEEHDRDVPQTITAEALARAAVVLLTRVAAATQQCGELLRQTLQADGAAWLGNTSGHNTNKPSTDEESAAARLACLLLSQEKKTEAVEAAAPQTSGVLRQLFVGAAGPFNRLIGLPDSAVAALKTSAGAEAAGGEEEGEVEPSRDSNNNHNKNKNKTAAARASQRSGQQHRTDYALWVRTVQRLLRPRALQFLTATLHASAASDPDTLGSNSGANGGASSSTKEKQESQNQQQQQQQQESLSLVLKQLREGCAAMLTDAALSDDTLYTMLGQIQLNAHAVNDFILPPTSAARSDGGQDTTTTTTGDSNTGPQQEENGGDATTQEAKSGDPSAAPLLFRWFIKGAGIYCLLANFNHSCSPNVAVYPASAAADADNNNDINTGATDTKQEECDPTTTTTTVATAAGKLADGITHDIVLKPLRDVAADEELCISYIPVQPIPPLPTSAAAAATGSSPEGETAAATAAMAAYRQLRRRQCEERRATLRESYYFTCQCPRCVEDMQV